MTGKHTGAGWSGTRRSFDPSTRRRILTRDPTCTLQLPGCTQRSTIADHVVGVADATAQGWPPSDIHDPSNGQGVCSTCHDSKTAAEIRRGLARAARAGKPIGAAATAHARKRPQTQHPGILPPADQPEQ